jgi:adenine-specific DNA-methyltransferase
VTTEEKRRIADPDLNQHIRDRPNHKPTRMAPDSFFVPQPPTVQESVAARTAEVAKQLHSSLGAPFFEQPGFLLYNADLLDCLAGFARAGVQVNLTITSPPYNIGKEYEAPQEVSEYVEWCSSWMQAIHSATASHGAFWLNLGYFEVLEKGLCVPIPYLLWDRSPFYLLQEVVWHYGAGVSTRKRLAPRNEKWLFFVKDPKHYTFNLDEIRDPNVKYPNQRRNGKLRCNPLGKNPSDVWEFPKVTTGRQRSSKERTDHPAQFPLRVVERIVRGCSSLGDVVLDPFAGSGSAGIAAAAFGRVFVGIEIEKRYCEMAGERLGEFNRERAQELEKLSLF